MTENCVIVFLNAPEPDKISQELKNAFGPERACHIYSEMVKEVFSSLKRMKGVFVVVVYERTSKHPDLLWLDSDDPGFLEPLPGASACDRVIEAFRWSFNAGARRIVLLSAQSPGVPKESIEKAFNGVSDKNIVLGPTYDGGIYLLALPAAEAALLEGYPWPSKKARDEIADRARRLRLEVQLLPEFYSVKDDQTLQQWVESKSESRPASAGGAIGAGLPPEAGAAKK